MFQAVETPNADSLMFSEETKQIAKQAAYDFFLGHPWDWFWIMVAIVALPLVAVFLSITWQILEQAMLF